MKISRYNHIINKRGKSYWFNALSKMHFILDETLGKKLSYVLENDTDYTKLPSFLFEKLVSSGFLIEDDVDELAIIRSKNEEAIHSKNYLLSILPTLNCNFKCWYCIQEHIPSKMDESMVERLKKHINYMIDVKEISSLHIEWFGGEPFMYFEKVMQPILSHAVEKCRISSIPFSTSATTNGFFLSESVAYRLAGYSFSHFQITLDGNREFHDKVKFQNGCESAFDRVLGNINTILCVNPSINITLRINYTHDNLSTDIVRQVCSMIDKANRSRIIVMPRKVWQKSVDKNYHNELRPILDLFTSEGFRTSRWSPVTNFIPCYANKEFYNSINYNGAVVKCTACDDLYAEDPKGNLLPDGSIEWKDSFDIKYQSKSFENDLCLNCNILPACMGSCPRNYLNGQKKCNYELVDGCFEDELIDYIENYDNDYR